MEKAKLHPLKKKFTASQVKWRFYVWDVFYCGILTVFHFSVWLLLVKVVVLAAVVIVATMAVVVVVPLEHKLPATIAVD